jgi:hypothetical protein
MSCLPLPFRLPSSALHYFRWQDFGWNIMVSAFQTSFWLWNRPTMLHQNLCLTKLLRSCITQASCTFRRKSGILMKWMRLSAVKEVGKMDQISTAFATEDYLCYGCMFANIDEKIVLDVSLIMTNLKNFPFRHLRQNWSSFTDLFENEKVAPFSFCF